MITTTLGFRHGSIETARQVMSSLAGASGGEFTVTATEDLSTVSAANLANYEVLFFALTTGELPFTADQKTAILDFMNRGSGFLGTHSATDTLYEWADYGMLVGAYFKEHPWTQQATVVVEDQSHPAASGLGERYSTGDYPLAWTHSVGNGRSYYNALGHFDETWRDPRFQRQLTGAIRWVARR